jgi:hypothetical protein
MSFLARPEDMAVRCRFAALNAAVILFGAANVYCFAGENF